MSGRRNRAERPARHRLVLTSRDRAIVHAVGRMAQATTDQIARLFFSERSLASRRLAKLVSERLLDVHVCAQSDPNVYTLGSRAKEALGGAERAELHASRVGGRLDLHLRALNDLRVDLVLAARGRDDVELEAFHADLDLRRVAGAVLPPYIPDALVELATPHGRLVLIVEIDTGSEGVSVFSSKVAATVSLWRAGLACWGAAPGTWRPAAFVFTEARARSLSRVIVDHGGSTLWLLAELPRVRLLGALGPVFATAEEIVATPRGTSISYAGTLAPTVAEAAQ